MSYELDRMTVERVQKEQDEFTTPERLIQINHEFSTQLNESLNMAIGRGAPKHKHFSRSQSIYYRIAHVIITHNLGIARFVHRLFNLLNITPTTVLVSWLSGKELWREQKKIYDNDPKNKNIRAHKANAKQKHERYLEQTETIKDGTYRSGIGCETKRKKKKKRVRKEKSAEKHQNLQDIAVGEATISTSTAQPDPTGDQSKPKTTRTRKLCDCGQGSPHKSSRYDLCARNKKNLAKLAEIKDPKKESDCVSSSHTNTLIDTTKLT